MSLYPYVGVTNRRKKYLNFFKSGKLYITNHSWGTLEGGAIILFVGWEHQLSQGDSQLIDIMKFIDKQGKIKTMHYMNLDLYNGATAGDHFSELTEESLEYVRKQ